MKGSCFFCIYLCVFPFLFFFRSIVRLCLLCRMSAQHFPCVCVLIKPFFLLVNIQHTHWPRWFFILDRYKFYGNKTTIQAATLYQVDSSININGTIQCHCAGLWQTQHTYASYPDTLKQRKKKDKETRNETKRKIQKNKTNFKSKQEISKLTNEKVYRDTDKSKEAKKFSEN